METALKGLPRLDSDALGPCAICGNLLLESSLPIFFRFKVRHCGIDANEVRRHVGLAASMAPGLDGLALASVLGPKVEPVVVMQDWDDVNVCHACATSCGILQLVDALMEKKG